MPRILLLEDDDAVRGLLDHVLRGGRYDVDPVATLASGRAFLQARHYDLLVTDLLLPDGSGTELAYEAGRRGIPAIIITAYPLQFTKRDLAHFALLLKPVRPNELLEAVARALTNGRQT